MFLRDHLGFLLVPPPRDSSGLPGRSGLRAHSLTASQPPALASRVSSRPQRMRRWDRFLACCSAPRPRLKSGNSRDSPGMAKWGPWGPGSSHRSPGASVPLGCPRSTAQVPAPGVCVCGGGAAERDVSAPRDSSGVFPLIFLIG